MKFAQMLSILTSIVAVIIGFTAVTAVEEQNCPMVPYCDDDSQYLYHRSKLILQKRCPPDHTLKNITGTEAGVCACEEGYYWKDDQTCVLKDDCCGKNEEATNRFQNCPARCPHYRPPYTLIKVTCVTENHHDQLYCSCKEGYVLDIYGECTKLEDCPTCGANQWFVECPNPCPRTCLNRNDKGTLCAAMCLREGCMCEGGYVRDMDRNCIREDDCPKCGENEEYIELPPPCPGTCSNPKGIPGCRMVQEKEGCACKDGYVRNEVGACVDLDSCCKNEC